MSHRLDLRGRMDGPEPTISLADLLLTKLQIWQINRRISATPSACSPTARSARAGPMRSVDRLASVLGSDWGFCHTAKRNLDRIGRAVGAEPVPDALST